MKTLPPIVEPERSNAAVVVFVKLLLLWQVRDWNAIMKLTQPSWQTHGKNSTQVRAKIFARLQIFEVHAVMGIKSTRKSKNMYSVRCDAELSMRSGGSHVVRQVRMNIVCEGNEWFFNPASVEFREFTQSRNVSNA